MAPKIIASRSGMIFGKDYRGSRYFVVTWKMYVVRFSVVFEMYELCEMV